MRTERGPSRLWPILVAAVGLVLATMELVRVIRAEPAGDHARDLTGLLLSTALALGGFSLVRVLQHLLVASRWPTTGERVAEPSRRLRDAHAAQAIWAAGVGASLALMGLLGLWSMIDETPSGLEPGWHLLLAGALTASVALGAARRIDQRWDRIEEAAWATRPSPGQRWRDRDPVVTALGVPGRQVGYSRLVGGSPPSAVWRRLVL